MPLTAANTKKPGTTTSLSSLKQIDAGVLNVGYVEAGPADGPVVILLHGWPYDIHSYADVAPWLGAAGYRVIVPHLRGHGTTEFLDRDTLRSGEQAALAHDIVGLMDALGIEQAILAGYDWGARTANVIAALWPQRCKAMVSAGGYMIDDRRSSEGPLPPLVEWGWWYQYYLVAGDGRPGLEANQDDLAKLVWRVNSPKWDFDDATFDQTAASFRNPDYVSIAIHNYRWRLGVTEGDPRYAGLEQRLGRRPVITVPTITLAGAYDGVTPATDGASFRSRFSGRYTHRIIEAAGHNLPQEAPQAFADAIVEVDSY